MSKQNVILKITVTEETVRVKMKGYNNSMVAGLAEVIYENKDLEEIFLVTLKVVEDRRSEENQSRLAKEIKAILAGMEKVRDSPEKPDKKDTPT